MFIPAINCLTISLKERKMKTGVGNLFKKKLLIEYEQRFSDYEEISLCSIATILGPRYNRQNFQKALAALKAVQKINYMLKQKNNKETEKTTNPSPCQEKTVSVWRIHERLVKKPGESTDSSNGISLHEELKQYFKLELLDRNTNIIQYWKNSSSVFPKLSQIAMKYLPLLASSVPSEQFFSSVGSIKNDLRNRLTGEHLNELIFLSN